MASSNGGIQHNLLRESRPHAQAGAGELPWPTSCKHMGTSKLAVAVVDAVISAQGRPQKKAKHPSGWAVKCSPYRPVERRRDLGHSLALDLGRPDLHPWACHECGDSARHTGTVRCLRRHITFPTSDVRPGSQCGIFRSLPVGVG